MVMYIHTRVYSYVLLHAGNIHVCLFGLMLVMNMTMNHMKNNISLSTFQCLHMFGADADINQHPQNS